jgi:hypothetical protein
MPPRRSPAQIRSQLRQAQQRRKRAIDDYNRKVRKAVDDYNAGLRKVSREIDRHNSAVRTRNNKVRSNRQQLQREIDRLNRTSQRTTVKIQYRTSVRQITTSFETLERRAKEAGWAESDVFAWSSAEAANSVAALNALLEEADAENDDDPAVLRDSRLGTELAELDADLDARWRGALFALHPDNPDAARHFCTSAREMLTRILSTVAPTEAVLGADPNAARTEDGKLTRRARIQYCLTRRNVNLDGLGEFVDDDIDNVISLFGEFNDGTHGSAGRFTTRQLVALKTRVEDAVLYIFNLVR